MRRAIIAAATLFYAACNCSPRLSNPGPKLVVVKPTAKVADEWILDFGQVQVGGQYALPILIENDGRLSGTLSTIQIRAGSDPAFSLPNARAPLSIDPGHQGEVDVAYNPLQIGAVTKPSYVDIATDDPGLPTVTVRLVANAQAGVVQVCVEDGAVASGWDCNVQPAGDGGVQPGLPLVIDFGTLQVTSTPTTASRNVQVRNIGTNPLSYAGTTFEPGSSTEYTLNPGQSAGSTIAPGANVQFAVVFTVVHGGVDTATADVASNDPNNPVVQILIKGKGDAPRLCITPSPTLDFGSVVVGTPTQNSVVLSSCGTQTVTLNALSLVPGQSPNFAITSGPSLPLTMPVGATANVVISYDPSAVAPDTGQLQVQSTDPATPTAFENLQGNGVASNVCALQVSPTSVSFGSVSLTGFAEQTVALVNVGQQPCLLQSATLSGSSAFTITASSQGTPASITPNGVYTTTVHYQPTATQQDSGSLTFASNDPANPSIVVPITGTGTNPGPCQFQFVPSSVAFGQVSVGQTSTQNLSMYNFGTSDCTVISASFASSSSGAFSLGSPMIPNSISSNQKLDFTVYFAPHKGGSFSGTIDILAGPSPLSLQTYTVPVTGSAVSPTLCLIPTSLNFGTVAAGSTKTLSFNMQSCGAGTLEVRGLSIGAGSSPAFTLVSPPTPPIAIAQGTSAAVTVQYAPKAGGPDLGQVVVLSNDGTQPTAYVSLTGNVANPCNGMLACSPASLTFPQTNVGQTSTLTFSCANVGTVAVPITAIQLKAGSPGSFTVIAPPVTSLAPGQTVRVAVDFSPTAAGAATGNAEVDSGDCRAPTQLIAVNATGVQPTYPPCLPPSQFQPVTKWQWSGSPNVSSYTAVFAQPAVAPLIDTNGDGLINENDIPAIIFPSLQWPPANFNPQNVDPSPQGVLRALRGDTGAEIWTVSDPNYRIFSTYTPAVGDIDGDNVNEIVTGLYYESPGSGSFGISGKFKTGRLIAFRNDGSVKWLSDWWTRTQDDIEDDSAISIADLNGDGVPEIIIGASVFDANGTLLWEGSGGAGDMGHGALSVIADLDGDGKAEVIGGNTAYHSDGTVYWTYGTQDGLPIVVDVDGDGIPEVVLRNDVNQFVVLNHDGTVKHGPFTFAVPTTDPTTGQQTSICPATITAADFNGDGLPEIGIPAGDTYYLYKADGTLLWSAPIEDYIGQCGAAGTGAFDFTGKGYYDAVYNDAENVWAFDGKTGNVIYKASRNSATILECPVIADVDNDGHADIVVTQSGSPGLIALSNTGNNWASTRVIWNQHTYHVTNIGPGGSVPRVEGAGWKKFNAYRAQMPLCQ